MAVQKLASMTAPLPETSFQPRRCLQRRCSCIHSRTAASAAETARSASAAGRRSTAACPSCCAFCWPSVLCCRMGDSDSSVAWHATPLHLLVELLSDDLRDLLRLLLILRNLSSAGSWRFRRCRRYSCLLPLLLAIFSHGRQLHGPPATRRRCSCLVARCCPWHSSGF